MSIATEQHEMLVNETCVGVFLQRILVDSPPFHWYE
jgi:hypothetical protein